MKSGGSIQLYSSDSDISSEQQSTEGSGKGGGRGATDSSYCSYSPPPTLGGQGGPDSCTSYSPPPTVGGPDSHSSYSPAPTPAPCHHSTPLHYTAVQNPVHSVGLSSYTVQPQYSAVQQQYSTVQAQYSQVQPCCQGYRASLSSLPPPSTFSLPPSYHPLLPPPSSLPLDCNSETASLLARETPL